MNCVKNNKYRAIIFTSVNVTFFVAVTIFLYRAYIGLSLFSFTDEFDKLVAAQMIHNGMHLYKDIFSHHGPLLYIFSHAYVSLISSTDFTAIRSIIAAIALLVAWSLAASPVLSSNIARFWAVSTYLMLLSSVWWVQGIHMLLYHGLGGFFLTIIFSQLAVPLLLEKPVGPFNLFFSGAAAALSIACAYTFILPVFLLALSVISCIVDNKQKYRVIDALKFGFSGFFSIIILIAIWLVLFGDLKGYWVYHIYFNQVVYLKVLTFSIFDAFNSLVISYDPKKIIGSIATLALVFSVILIVRQLKKLSIFRLFSISAMIVSVLMINPRGDTIFQNAGYVITCLALFSLQLAYAIDLNVDKKNWREISLWIVLTVAIVILVELVSRNAVSTPTEVSRKDFHSHAVELKPSAADRYALIRRLVDPGERIQALTVNPEEYIFSGRLPATGNFFYLPWQAFYNKDPVAGYKIDLCKQLAIEMPPLIIFDDVKIWGFIALSEYEPCVVEMLKKNYIKLPKPENIFVRPDRMPRINNGLI